MMTMLVLNIAPELEEDLVDYLLSLTFVNGFTSYKTRGHGDNANMTVAEQVSGRRKRLQFELLMDVENVPELLSGLANEVGKDINYWQQSVSNIGEIV